MYVTNILAAFIKSFALAIAIFAISACATYSPHTSTSRVNVAIASMEPAIGENPAYVAPVMPTFRTPGVLKSERKLSLRSALAFENEVGFGDIEMNFSDINDKALRHNPAFNQKWYDKTVHTSKTYTGHDYWGSEFGADLLTRMEYYLIRDARHLLVSKEYSMDNYFSHHEHSSPVLKAKRPKLFDNSKGLNDAFNWLQSLNVDDVVIEKYTFYCMANAYSKMKSEQGSAKERVTHWYALLVDRKLKPTSNGFVRYRPKSMSEYIARLSRNNNELLESDDIKAVMSFNILERKSQCEAFKDSMLINGQHIFHSKPPAKVENGVFKTVNVTEARFEPRLFQRLFTKAYYSELTRVSANGPFSSLRRPDGRNIVMEYNTRRTGMPWDQKEDIDVNMFGNNVEALKSAVLVNAWVGDSYFIHNYNEREWSKQFKRSFPYAGNENGLLTCRTNTQEMNLQLANHTIRRVYDCSVQNNQNKFTNAFVRILKGPGTDGSLFATIDIEGRDFGGSGYAEDMKASFANKDLFAQNKPLMVDGFVESRLLKKVPANTAVAYIQRLADGKVEGVVHVLGYKVVYDLTEMSDWYREEMVDIYPDNQALETWSTIHATAKVNAEKQYMN